MLQAAAGQIVPGSWKTDGVSRLNSEGTGSASASGMRRAGVAWISGSALGGFTAAAATSASDAFCCTMGAGGMMDGCGTILPCLCTNNIHVST